MSRADPSWALTLLSLVSCGASQQFLELPPAPAGATRWSLAVIGSDSTMVMKTGAADSPPIVSLQVTDGPSGGDPFSAPGWSAPLRAELAWFDQDLGVPAGDVPLLTAGSTGTGGLPAPLSAYRARIDRGVAPAFAEASWSGLASSQARVASRTPCGALRSTVYSWANTKGASWALPDGDQVLVGSPDGGFARIGRNGDARAVLLTPPGASTRSALRDAQGRLWLGGSGGEVWVGSVGSTVTLEPVAQLDSTQGLLGIAADPDRPEQELYVISATSAVTRLSGGATRSFGVVFPRVDIYASIAWVEPGVAIAASSMSPTALLIEGEVATALPVSLDGAGIFAVRRVEGLGVMASSIGGAVYRYDRAARAFHHLGQSELKLNVAGFAPVAGGFLYAGTYGYAGEWIEGFGFCPLTAEPFGNATARALVPIGDAWLMIGEADRGMSHTPFSILELTRP